MQKDRNEKAGASAGEMIKRRETMADGRRYVIYYTFAEDDQPASNNPDVERFGSLVSPDKSNEP